MVYKDAHSLTHDQLRCCAEVFLHPCFTRALVVQEIVLAKRATIQCGEKQLDYERMVLSVDLLMEALSTITFTEVLHPYDANKILSYMSDFRDIDLIKRLLDGNNPNALMSFRAFATSAQGKQATTPLDKVHELLALAPPTFMEFLSFDYSLQVKEVYANLALYL